MSLNVNSMVSNLYTSNSANFKQSNTNVKNTKASETVKTSKAVTSVDGKYGKAIGDVKLSEAGAKYYDELKKKFGDLDFILVSDDETNDAESKAQDLVDSEKTAVLIDASTIEKMASDQSYRDKFEGIIKDGAENIKTMSAQLESSGANVKSFGIRVNADGTSSFFATLNKSSADQKARIEKHTAEKKEAKKVAEKKAEAKRTEKKEAQEKLEASKKEADTITFTADSIEDLMKKINDYTVTERSDLVRTDAELALGQSIDFKG